MKLKKGVLWIPLLLFVGLTWILLRGLLNENKTDTAPQINKPAPAFNLASLQDTTQFYTQEALKGQVSIVNFWATWCPPCRQEHPVLVDIANEYPVFIVGINYKDKARDALQWLTDLGNPYSLILTDVTGRAGIDWGVIAVPETFVVDAEGIVRYKHTGPITWKQWENEIWPRIKKLTEKSS
jgi:cytochrome c biogenesis protein CcmG/thiol:disulfide interchange protein DsbE